MDMGNVNLLKLKCKRCNHSWVPRVNGIKKCPKCSSYNWDKEIDEK